MPMITHDTCPSCGSGDISKKLVCKDHTVSGELFEIWECTACTLRFTQHIPELRDIAGYYKSEKYISHTDTRKGVINTLYHSIRKRTLKSKEQLLSAETGLRNGRLLDIGAGTGAFAHHMKTAGWDVTALEPDPDARDKAVYLYNLRMQPADDIWQLSPASFDVISMWHVLEHVHDLKGYVSQVEKLLKPGGKAFIAVPNYTSVDASTYKEYWAAYDVPRHLYHFSPASFRKLIKLYQLRFHDIRPMWYDSFYVSMLSEKYKRGKNNYLKALTTGLRSNIAAMQNKERCSSVIYIVEKPAQNLTS